MSCGGYWHRARPIACGVGVLLVPHCVSWVWNLFRTASLFAPIHRSYRWVSNRRRGAIGCVALLSAFQLPLSNALSLCRPRSFSLLSSTPRRSGLPQLRNHGFQVCLEITRRAATKEAESRDEGCRPCNRERNQANGLIKLDVATSASGAAREI